MRNLRIQTVEIALKHMFHIVNFISLESRVYHSDQTSHKENMNITLSHTGISY